MNTQALRKLSAESPAISHPEEFCEIIETAYRLASLFNPLNPDVTGMADVIMTFEGYKQPIFSEDFANEEDEAITE